MINHQIFIIFAAPHSVLKLDKLLEIVVDWPTS
jgi:hypothetical protein